MTGIREARAVQGKLKSLKGSEMIKGKALMNCGSVIRAVEIYAWTLLAASEMDSGDSISDVRYQRILGVSYNELL